MRRFASWPALVGWPLAALVVTYCGLVGLRVLYPITYTSQLVLLAEVHALDPAHVAAVTRCESRFKTRAISPRGALGLMQLMPETGAWIAQQLGVTDFEAERLYEPSVNLQFGTWYLRYLLDRFGDWSGALAAYNAGPSNAERWQIDPSSVFPETRAYVHRVLRSVPVYRFFLSAPWLLRITPSLLF
jgi:soluble lytic murein transglycosylase